MHKGKHRKLLDRKKMLFITYIVVIKDSLIDEICISF